MAKSAFQTMPIPSAIDSRLLNHIDVAAGTFHASSGGGLFLADSLSTHKKGKGLYPNPVAGRNATVLVASCHP